jgi:hypothetical protein
MFAFIVIVYVKRDLEIQTSTNTKFNSPGKRNKQ